MYLGAQGYVCPTRSNGDSLLNNGVDSKDENPAAQKGEVMTTTCNLCDLRCPGGALLHSLYFCPVVCYYVLRR